MLEDLYKSQGPNHFPVRPTTQEINNLRDLTSFLEYLFVAIITNPFFLLVILSSLPIATYVKVYLLNNGAYVAKKKTKIARKTLDPLYQQALLFEESPHGKVLQVGPYYSLITKIYKLMLNKSQ